MAIAKVFRELGAILMRPPLWLLGILGAIGTILLITEWIAVDFHPVTWLLIFLLASILDLCWAFWYMLRQRDKALADLKEAQENRGPTLTLFGGPARNVSLLHNLIQQNVSTVSSPPGDAIRLAHLVEFTPSPVIQDRTFTDEDLYGPVILWFAEGVRFEGERSFDPSTEELFYDIENGREIPGVIQVVRTTFRDCRFHAVGVIRSKPPPEIESRGQ